MAKYYGKRYHAIGTISLYNIASDVHSIHTPGQISISDPTRVY